MDEAVLRALLCHILEIHESLGEWVLLKWLTTAGGILWEFTYADEIHFDESIPQKIMGSATVLSCAQSTGMIVGGYHGPEVTMILEPAGEPVRSTTPEVLHEVVVPTPHVRQVPGGVPAGAAG